MRRTLAGVAGHDAEQLQAVRRFEAGDFATAARLLVALLARTPPDATLLRMCGMAQVRTGAVASGLPYLARARRLAPRDPLAALWLGIALHAAERFADAAAALQAAAQLSPADPAPLIHLARALLRLGRPRDALAAAERAVSTAPALLEAHHARALAEVALRTAPAAAADPQHLADAWLDLGLVCLRLGNVADARGALQQALAAQPSHAVAAAELAIVDHLCGEPVTALSRLRALLAQHPDCAIVRLHLASRLILDGDAAGAWALLQGPAPEPALQARWQAQRIEALVALRRHDEARRELVLVRAPTGDAEILLTWQRFLLARQAGDGRAGILADRVAALAADRGTAGLESRIQAHFALGALRHAEARRETAFAHWQAGHALLRLAQPFSRTRHAALMDSITGTYGRDRLQAGPCAASIDPTPVFIVGLPRTGTTLTEHILSAHPAVHGAGERLAVRETLQRLTGSAQMDEAATRAACLDAPALSEAAADYLASLHALSPDASVILDKMPDNVWHLGFIATLLPGARVICCTRDLRDVGASIFQHGFLGHHPYAHDLTDLGWTLAQHERLLRHWHTALPLPMLMVDHADWVGDFDATLRRVLDFLGLPYDPACARFDEQDRNGKTASRDQVALPINARGVGRWRPYATQLAPMLRELPAPGGALA